MNVTAWSVPTSPKEIDGRLVATRAYFRYCSIFLNSSVPEERSSS